MTSIDFYILKTEVFRDYLNFIGKLTEKAYLKNHDVFIHTNDEKLMIKVDEALWSFRENSFLPHSNEKSFNNEEKKPLPKNEKESPKIKNQILIGYSGNPYGHQDILINLCSDTPKFFGRFKRLIEIVMKNENTLKYSRERYKYYKDRGYPINIHNL